MERLTRASTQFLSRLAKGTAGYMGVNVVLLASEARWHLLTKLTVWDISEMKTFVYLLGKTIHH